MTLYTHGKYQFAFLAYHMLTMSCVYFNIWQIRQTRPEDFEKGLICLGFDVESLADRPGIEGMRELHAALAETYKAEVANSAA